MKRQISLSMFLAAVLGGLAVAQPPAPVPVSVLVLLDGKSIPFQSLAISGQELSGAGVPAGLTLDDLRRIELAPKSPTAVEKPAVSVQLRGGGLILGQAATIADDQCIVAWSHGPPLKLPIDVVRAIRFEPATEYAEFDKAVAAPSAESDRIFLKVDGKFDSLSGLVVGLSAEELTFDLAGEERKVPRGKLFGIAVAQPQAEDDAVRCLLSLAGGSQLGGDLVKLADDVATIELPGGSKLALPWPLVTRVQVSSSRVAFLSDLKPTAVEQAAIVTAPRSWRRDRSVLGKTLTLADRTFEKGIGTHARSLLTFDAGGKYDTFAAVIGIDGETAGKGDCVFTVLGDGQPLVTRRMKGTDPP
ncbi:MAG: NPCBM/NEW2 domain-containing protein, partial [Pirellulaceae bacterium]|nr:NPCBM/NEW2 domain-containing protein [Pirellulaceae bacterium]